MKIPVQKNEVYPKTEFRGVWIATVDFSTDFNLDDYICHQFDDYVEVGLVFPEGTTISNERWSNSIRCSKRYEN